MAKRKWGKKPSQRAVAQRHLRAKRAKRSKREKKRAEGPGVIELRTKLRWRNKRTGQLVPFKKRKGAIVEKVQIQVDAKGKIIRETGFNTAEEVKRTVVPGLIKESGEYAGLVGIALDKTNVMSPSSLKGARKILVKVSGTDPQGHRESFKFDIDSQTVSKRRKVLRSVLLGSILYEMRSRSWRTWYRINQVDWSKTKHTSQSAARKRVPMRDVEIVVRVLK